MEGIRQMQMQKRPLMERIVDWAHITLIVAGVSAFGGVALNEWRAYDAPSYQAETRYDTDFLRPVPTVKSHRK